MKDKSSSMSNDTIDSLCEGSVIAISFERNIRLEFCILTATMIAVTSCLSDRVSVSRFMLSEHNLQ